MLDPPKDTRGKTLKMETDEYNSKSKAPNKVGATSDKNTLKKPSAPSGTGHHILDDKEWSMATSWPPREEECAGTMTEAGDGKTYVKDGPSNRETPTETPISETPSECAGEAHSKDEGLDKRTLIGPKLPTVKPTTWPGPSASTSKIKREPPSHPPIDGETRVNITRGTYANKTENIGSEAAFAETLTES